MSLFFDILSLRSIPVQGGMAIERKASAEKETEVEE